MTSDNKVHVGKAERLTEVIHNKIGDNAIESSIAAEDAETQLNRATLSRNGNHMSEITLLETLERTIDKNYDRSQLAALEVVPSDNIYVGPTERLIPTKLPINK